jgi:pimeloyl-ACP methyl ester carboxylesterase
MDNQVFYRTVKVDGTNIFYREAGHKDAPTLLLLHGLPSSSRMFQALLIRLADKYHLIAPDYPGYGHSDWPDPKQFDYAFDHIARVIDGFTRALGLPVTPFTCRITAVQWAFAWLWHIRNVWKLSSCRMPLLTMAGSERTGRLAARSGPIVQPMKRHCERIFSPLQSREHATSETIPNVELYDPDLWTDEYAFLNGPGQAQIQSDLFYDYRTNVDAYLKWQAWMQKTQPALLVIWGKHDLSFDPGEPERYRKDVPNAEVHVIDAGHFALDTKADEIAAIVRQFISAHVTEAQSSSAR